jgi:tRNA (mo5U34)-methyltransferase
MAGGVFEYVRGWKQEFEAKGWWHSFDLPDGRRIEGVCSADGLRTRIEQYPIPADLRGARVLDIGAWDGWYTFEMERRGADVVAVDCWDNPRFHQIHSALKSRAEYRVMDVYELTPQTVGQFDIVLFMGVLYHLKHPLLALERVCALTRDLAVVDSFILREEHRPGENVENRSVMEFYETEEFGGQTDNWCGPSLPCLMAMCRTAGFARVEHRASLPNGACLACYRKWDSVADVNSFAPELLDAVHHTNFGINFHSKYDEYVLATFRTGELDPSNGDPRVEPQVGEFGSCPVHLSRSELGVWQTKFKLPPGLKPGWHNVSVRVCGVVSSPRRIALDIPLHHSKIRIGGLTDGTSWEQGILDRKKGTVLSAWVTGMPENADRANVRVLLGGEQVPVIFVSPPEGWGARQVNIDVPEEVPAGLMELEISVGASKCLPGVVQII